jgi:hypothetical protein
MWADKVLGLRFCVLSPPYQPSAPGPPQVEMLLEWASGGGCELRAACPGPRGLTPLHLAAVMDDAGRMATLLTGVPHPCCRLCPRVIGC